ASASNRTDTRKAAGFPLCAAAEPREPSPSLEISDNLRADPLSNWNRDAIPDHSVRIVRAADESKCVGHTLKPRVFSHGIRSHAVWKSSIDNQSGAQVFRVKIGRAHV